MRGESASDVVELLDGSLDATALGAAMELGLFWLLAEAPRNTATIAGELGIPPRRCELWLRCVQRSGLLERTAAGWGPTERARVAVLATWSQPTWSLLAQEARERLGALEDLPRRLLGQAPARSDPSYVAKMVADPVRARRFTRMLRELHEQLAEDVAAALDLAGVRRVLDIGGGSGVVAMALARRSASLEAVVVDIPTVCAAGAEIVREAGLDGRVRHQALDLGRDVLPPGFDLVVECDVGLYDLGLFGRIGAALVPGGCLAIVDVLPRIGEPEPHLAWATLASLADPAYEPMTLAQVTRLLGAAGFAVAAPRQLPWRPGATAGEVYTIIEARR